MTRRWMMDRNIFDGFSVNIFLDEDGDYLAHFVEMPNVSAFSDTPEGAIKELAVAWKGVKESYQKHQETIPKAPIRQTNASLYNVPVDEQIFYTLMDEAEKAGMSLYALVSQKLKSDVSYLHEDTN